MGADFEFSAHKTELIVSNVFVRIYNEQPSFQLKNAKRFATQLIDFIGKQAQVRCCCARVTAHRAVMPTVQQLELGLELRLLSCAVLISHTTPHHTSPHACARTHAAVSASHHHALSAFLVTHAHSVHFIPLIT
jgi:hypothetical protein